MLAMMWSERDSLQVEGAEADAAQDVSEDIAQKVAMFSVSYVGCGSRLGSSLL